MLPDGSLSWKPVKVSTPFMTDIASDAPARVTLDATTITTHSLLAKCGISDADGATGACTLRDVNNTVVASWIIGADRPITGLTPGATYTLALVGTANRRNADNTLSTVGINRLLVVTTLAPTVTLPPAPVLSASVSGNTVSLMCPAVAGATGYDFYQGSTLLGSSTTCSYTVSGLADGIYTFTAKAKNSAGSSVASNSQTVNILNMPT